MSGFARQGSRQCVGRLAALVALAIALSFASVPMARAQGFGFFGNLFGGGPPPAYPGYARPQVYRNAAPRRRVRRRPVEPVQQRDRAPPAQTRQATTFVYVFGDSLGQLLANGLDDALDDRPEVAIVHKAHGSSGLVAQDRYDWPKAIDALLAGKDKIDVAVMMIGSNDRQPIHENGTTYEVGTPGWFDAYRRRVAAIDEAFRKKGVPLVWVGVPITKDGDFADDMAALNDIFRDAASKTGATYVDTWEAFSDDSGDFQAFGPDINGQTVRLRTSDGIYFTKAGARKLAHFVEAHVRRDLDGKAPTPPSPSPDGGQVATLGAPNAVPGRSASIKPAPAKAEIGEVRDLTAPPIAVRGELATPSLARLEAPHEKAALDRTFLDEARGTAPAGRADDLRWPKAGPDDQR